MKTSGLIVIACLLASCRQDMHDQPKLQPFEASAFFADGRASRPQVPGTVARGELFLDEHLYRGVVDGEPAQTLPFALDRALLDRGQERFEIFCSACHGSTGNGEGIVVRRGLKQPPSYHIERLREASPGYFFDVITNGFGAMYDLEDKVPVHDRWAIIAYIRALQLSQNATLDDVPEGQREFLKRTADR